MQLTTAQQKLVNDAKAAGYEIKIEATSVAITAKGRKTMPKGIRLWEDKTATRTDVELGSTTTIRTIKMMRSILGI